MLGVTVSDSGGCSKLLNGSRRSLVTETHEGYPLSRRSEDVTEGDPVSRRSPEDIEDPRKTAKVLEGERRSTADPKVALKLQSSVSVTNRIG